MRAAINIWLTCSGLACIGLLAAVLPTAGQPTPTIAVDPVILVEPDSRRALAIKVGPPEALPRNSFVRLRGLPPAVKLTEGHVIAPGAWAVPLNGLAALEIVVPAGGQGKSELLISLVTSNGQSLAEARTALVVAPAALLQPAETVATAPPVKADTSLALAPVPPPMPVPAAKAERTGPVAAPRPEVTPVAPVATVAPAPPVAPALPKLAAAEIERAARLVSRGNEQLAQGNVALARPFYRSAADIGLGLGALKLAQTYDPEELARLGVRSVQPDVAEARRWYERARDLGALEAVPRLLRLGGGR